MALAEIPTNAPFIRITLERLRVDGNGDAFGKGEWRLNTTIQSISNVSDIRIAKSVGDHEVVRFNNSLDFSVGDLYNGDNDTLNLFDIQARGKELDLIFDDTLPSFNAHFDLRSFARFYFGNNPIAERDVYVIPDAGQFILNGSGGDEGIDYTIEGSVDLHFADTVSVGTNLRDVQRTATDGRDVLIGLGGDDVLSGLRDRDALVGGDGEDTLRGDEQDDVLLGGRGADILEGGPGDDTLNGGAQRDTFLVSGTNDGFDDYIGDASNERQPVVDTIRATEPGTTIGLRSIQGINRIEGLGDTQIVAAPEGVTLDFRTPPGQVAPVLEGIARIVGQEGDDTFFGSAGPDTILSGAGMDELHGDEGIDTLRGGPNDDKLFGDGDNDAEFAGGGLFGGGGDDVINGGPGDDDLFGGPGFDRMFGEDGSDLYGFEDGDTGVGVQADIIEGFDARDLIDLSRIDARPDLEGNQSFLWVGDADFTAAGQLRLRIVSTGGVESASVQANLDADLLTIDLEISLADRQATPSADIFFL